MRKTETAEIRGLLEEIRGQLQDLAQRVAKLEGHTAAPSAPGAPAVRKPEPAGAEAEEPISEEILLAISASVAAFLGERVHVRSIRVLSSPAWAQQGRVSIQASHRLH
jgi:methylmalonyl-CoA carboxyltransferase 12S subunit